MRKNLFLVLCSLCFYLSSHLQTVSNNVIASEGGVAQAPGVSIEWTLGESFIESGYSGSKFYTQGFHQPLLLVKKLSSSKIISSLTADYIINLAPNPVLSVLSMHLQSNKYDESLFITVTDANGKTLMKKMANSKAGHAEINMTILTSGLYLLQVKNSHGVLINTFKVVKAQ